MENKKSAPKTKNNTLKSKTASIHTNVSKIKTAASVKSASVPISAVDTLKRQYVKGKAELQRQTEEQEQSPENYAVDTVEDKAESAVYTAADAVKQTGRYVKNVVQRRSRDRNIPNDAADISPPNVEFPQMALPEANQAPQEQLKIQARQNAAVKAKEHKEDIKTKENVASHHADELPKIKTKDSIVTRSIDKPSQVKTKDSVIARSVDETPKIKTKQVQVKAQKQSIAKKNVLEPVKNTNTVPEREIQHTNVSASAPKMRIKTKSEYLQVKTAQKGHTYQIKSGTVYSKPKTLQAVREKERQQQPMVDKAQAAKKYVQNKLKSKDDLRRNTEALNTDFVPAVNTPETDIVTSGDVSTANILSQNELNTQQKAVPNQRIHEEIKVKKTDIKTRESYIRTHAQTADIKVKELDISKKNIISGERRLIKSKSSEPRSKPTGKPRIVKTARKSAKTAQKSAKKAVKTQKQAVKAAKQTVKRTKELARQSARAAKAAVKATVAVTKKVAQAVVAVAKALISAIAALGGWAVRLVVLIVVIIMAAIAASPFGIFFSEEANDAGSIPLSQIIAEYNVELTQETEDVELSVDHTEVEVIDNRTDNNIVIAVFAAKFAGAEDDTAEDVVVFDYDKAEKLKGYFRTANEVTYETEETGDEENPQVSLTITIEGKTKDEFMDEYDLTEKQREAVETLLAHGDILTSSSHSLAITDADVQSIINGLPDSLPQKRKDVVKNAGSLVGKVNYFWGGKSSAIGWDSAWGTMQRVTAAGSPSSGTIRAYGLDCSGYVSWAFNNSGMYVGDGTYGQRDRSMQVSASAVQAGDLCFLSSYSHVGIVVGKDADGNILVFRCSSSANNVVVSTASSVGFTVFRRPNCY
ncbi:MAG: NlpC/P60 family protein [bacterium]|nr:NlpC/P60 family protein [bacterium]